MHEFLHFQVKKQCFFCVGVMYSGEYDACDVTLSVYPHRKSLKNMPACPRFIGLKNNVTKCLKSATSSSGHFAFTAERSAKMALGSTGHMTPRISGCFETIIYVKLNIRCLFTNKCEVMNYLPTYSSVNTLF